jgi:hypothetical protein
VEKKKKKNQEREPNWGFAKHLLIVDDFLKNELKLRDLAQLLGEQYGIQE